jgi:hypothetical protein
VGRRIDGNAANQTNATIGIGVAGRNGITIDRCELYNLDTDAIRASGTCNDLTQALHPRPGGHRHGRNLCPRCR